MKNIMAFGAIKNMVCCLAVLLPLQLSVSNMAIVSPSISSDITMSETEDAEPVPSKTRVVLLDLNGEYCDTKCFLAQNDETLEFISKTFGADKEEIVEDLITRNENTKYNKYNIGNLTNKNGELKQYSSFEKGLIEYMYVYAKENPTKINKTRTPYTGDADYVVDLIKYFTSIYDNVDYLTAVSIGAAESGYYKVSYMLKCNNIYGGMSSNGLIKYRNIEYGVLSYIRLLSNNYYAKGLTTAESIGRVYCPTYNETGEKVASSHWINLVTKAKKYYQNTTNEITVQQLTNTED